MRQQPTMIVAAARSKHKAKSEEEDSCMNIMALSIPDNICCNMELPSKITLSDFKLIAQLKLDIDESQQIVMFKGVELYDQDSQLEKFGISQRSVVYVIRKEIQAANINIVVKFKAVEKTISIGTNQLRQDLEKIAAQIFSFKQPYTKLIYCGGILTGSTVKDCRLVNMAVVNVKPQQQSRIRSKSMIIQNKKLEDEEEQEAQEELPPIVELAKEAQSIDDIDGEIFNELMKVQEMSETDSFPEDLNYAPQHICRNKRSFPFAERSLLYDKERIRSLRCQSPAVDFSIDLQPDKKAQDGDMTTSGSMIEKNPSFTYTPAPKASINFGSCQRAKLWQFHYV